MIATLLARKWGNSIGGWIIALPLTSAPSAYILAQSEGTDFARTAAIGMLAGTASQIFFVLAYRVASTKGWSIALTSGTTAFAISTLFLAKMNLSVVGAFAIVMVTFAEALQILNRNRTSSTQSPTAIPSWDLPARLVVATIVVFAITQSAPAIGSHFAGLLSPFPILAAIMAVFAHINQGADAANTSLRGLVLGLMTPTAFFFVLANTITTHGNTSFIYATIAGVIAQVISGKVLLTQKRSETK